ncbi:hypothetical protein ACIP3B_02090 [Streptomyces anulatus]|uniref:hypothetical protein n=1 Tax=Streptomyces anulatus TaxID=1892 RepID=UPI0033F3C02D
MNPNIAPAEPCAINRQNEPPPPRGGPASPPPARTRPEQEGPEPAQVELPDTATVDERIVTNWSTRRDETIPSIS